MRVLVGRVALSVVVFGFALLRAGVAASEAAIDVAIVTPAPTGHWPALVPVKVNVTSTFSLASVTASVGGSSVTLAPQTPGSPSWVGTLDLTGTPPSGLTLSVTARDVFGAEATKTGLFSLDNPPTLVLTSPQDFDIATPDVRVAASCTDDGSAPCTIEVRHSLSAFTWRARGSVDFLLPFGAYDGRLANVTISAVDGTGQRTSVLRRVNVIVPGALVERHRLPPGSQVLDVDASRILYAPGEDIAIRDRSTGAVQPIYSVAGSVPRSGWLTPAGAIFVASQAGYPFAAVHEWRNNTLVDLGPANSASSLRVAGQWTIWSDADTLKRRDLVQGITSDVSLAAGNINNDVGANGDVVFWNTSHQIQRFGGGTTTALTSDPLTWSTYPRTDGTLVVYRKTPPCCFTGPSAIAMDAGNGETVLAPDWGILAQPEPGTSYQVADGWIAFTKPDPSGTQQAWTRAPSGTLSQLSFAGSGVSLVTPRAADPAGRVLFGVNGTTYLADLVPGPGARVGPTTNAWWTAGRFSFGYASLVLELTWTPGCTYSVTPVPDVDIGGQPLDVSVSTDSSCGWSAVSEVSWITPHSATDGAGPGVVAWVVAPNAGAPRTGAVWVGGQRIEVEQDGVAGALDTDGDLLPDAWELLYGLNPLSVIGADGTGGDLDNDGRTNRTEFLQDSNPVGPDTRYFAEGASSSFFDTRFALLNPGDTDVVATLSFVRAQGVTAVDVPVAARTRVTVDPAQTLGPADAEFSTKVEAMLPLIVDRTMTWPRGVEYGAHEETGLVAPSTTWYLAEGATHGAFNLFYLIQNPNPTAAQVRVRYLRPKGFPLEKTYTFAPNSRTNIWVDYERFPDANGTLDLANTDVSAVFEVQNGQPIIVERAMYADVPGQLYGAGHESAAVPAPALEWFLAEGATSAPFDLYVLIANPTATDARVEATFLLPSGATVTRSYGIAAYGRFTVLVDLVDPLLASTSVSTTIRSTNGVPVVVERAMWWGESGGWYESHASAGATATSARWGFADGAVDAARRLETYILIANTSSQAATVKVTLLYEGGGSDERTFGPAELPGHGRFTVAASTFPNAAGKRFGAIVESVGTIPAQIVVERAMYWDAAGQTWAAGTNALATRLP